VAAWFWEHEISGEVLASLTEEDLLAMGMEPFGRRRQLLLSRAKLLEELGLSVRKALSPRTAMWSATPVLDCQP
ncbi:unnamed protein product, partial [Polarella glacialis]